MEKKTQTTDRQERFQRQAQLTREMADEALREIDEALQDMRTPSILNYEHVLGRAVLRGEVDVAEAIEALTAYEKWVETGESDFPSFSD